LWTVGKEQANKAAAREELEDMARPTEMEKEAAKAESSAAQKEDATPARETTSRVTAPRGRV
jgi:hypothetical protein